jgi:hypothetical protein
MVAKGHDNMKRVASLNPGTGNNPLWLLPSGPDQIHGAAMRGGPPPPFYLRKPDQGPHRRSGGQANLINKGTHCSSSGSLILLA